MSKDQEPQNTNTVNLEMSLMWRWNYFRLAQFRGSPREYHQWYCHSWIDLIHHVTKLSIVKEIQRMFIWWKSIRQKKTIVCPVFMHRPLYLNHITRNGLQKCATRLDSNKQALRLRYCLSSINYFLKGHAQPSSWARCLIFGQTIVFFHIPCVRTAKALTRLRGFTYVISTIISWVLGRWI